VRVDAANATSAGSPGMKAIDAAHAAAKGDLRHERKVRSEVAAVPHYRGDWRATNENAATVIATAAPSAS
jgi:hypothetical protein